MNRNSAIILHLGTRRYGGAPSNSANVSAHVSPTTSLSETVQPRTFTYLHCARQQTTCAKSTARTPNANSTPSPVHTPQHPHLNANSPARRRGHGCSANSTQTGDSSSRAESQRGGLATTVAGPDHRVRCNSVPFSRSLAGHHTTVQSPLDCITNRYYGLDQLPTCAHVRAITLGRPHRPAPLDQSATHRAGCRRA